MDLKPQAPPHQQTATQQVPPQPRIKTKQKQEHINRIHNLPNTGPPELEEQQGIRFSNEGRNLFIKETIQILVSTTILIFLILFNINFKYIQVDGLSMLPIINDHERLLMIQTKNIARGDLMVFEKKQQGLTTAIKRTVAIPGDWVEYKNGDLYVNNEHVPEFSNPETDAYMMDVRFQLDIGEYWVIGFNLNQDMSLDSRKHGVVREKEILGKVNSKKIRNKMESEIKQRKKEYEINKNKPQPDTKTNQQKEIEKRAKQEQILQQQILDNINKNNN